MTMTRGQRIEGGRYVGTTAQGIVWIAYRDKDYETMCEAFDALQIAWRGR